jgi:hypothetical protein
MGWFKKLKKKIGKSWVKARGGVLGAAAKLVGGIPVVGGVAGGLLGAVANEVKKNDRKKKGKAKASPNLALSNPLGKVTLSSELEFNFNNN